MAATRRNPTRPSEAVIKQLFARSGNRCAFPKCLVEIVQKDTTVGEVCHIKAVNPGGPRYDRHQTASERHGYKNLILLCGDHHTIIDDDEEAYTVDRLLRMKSDHEGRTGPINDDLAERGARFLVRQSLTAFNQSGGIAAHTIKAGIINVHAPRVDDHGEMDDDDPPVLRAAKEALLHKQRVAFGLAINPHALRIDVGEAGPFFYTRTKNLYKIRRTFNIKIENIDKHMSVSGCKVHLVDIEPKEYPGPWVLKDDFRLGAGDHIFVPLVTYGEAREPEKFACGDTFMVIHLPEPSPKPSASIEHILTLKVTSLETAPYQIQCKLWVDKSARLRIEKI
jgi:hypothetical protein